MSKEIYSPHLFGATIKGGSNGPLIKDILSFAESIWEILTELEEYIYMCASHAVVGNKWCPRRRKLVARKYNIEVANMKLLACTTDDPSNQWYRQIISEERLKVFGLNRY